MKYTSRYTLLIFSIIFYTDALEARNETETEAQRILQKYLDKIPDIDSKYVLNEGLSKSISRYFKDKLSVLPLFKMSVKIDRNPVKIPWTIQEKPGKKVAKSSNNAKIEYKYMNPSAASDT